MSGVELQELLFAHLKQSLLWLPVYGLLFGALAAVAPNIPGQKIWRAGTGTDLLYWFLTPPFYTLLYLLTAHAILQGAYGRSAQQARDYINEGSDWLAALPLAVQAIGVLLVSDLLQYWLHRLLHRAPLWRFHAIHHSPRELDWLSSSRFHPVNYYLSFTLPAVLFALIGVPAQTFLILAGFNAAFSYLVHANLNWTFGPARYLFASPVFHRWHHTSEAEGLNRNFAPTFPFIDLVFGTFFMPPRMPARFGIDDSVPVSFTGQMFYPFRRRTMGAGGAARPNQIP